MILHLKFLCIPTVRPVITVNSAKKSNFLKEDYLDSNQKRKSCNYKPDIFKQVE